MSGANVKQWTLSWAMAMSTQDPIDTGLQDWAMNGQFRKIRPFLRCADHEKTDLVIF